MHLDVDKADFHHVRMVDGPVTPLGPGQARLSIDAFGLTANNITYAVVGEAMNYWGCFPGVVEDGIDWGRLPVWGFADVVESASDEVAVGTRVYGYFPLAGELVIEPGRVDDQGFSDITPSRESVPSVYARYSVTTADRIYDPAREDQHILLWPLFITSFVVDDFLGDNGLFGATTAVISSASAKTAIGSAFLLAERPDLEVVGLTSAANRDFVADLGCYDRVLTYDDLTALDAVPTCYVDVAGRRDVTQAVHRALGDQLRHSMIVGDTHWDSADDDTEVLPGPTPELLFAPTQIAKRRTDWGRDGFETAVAGAWSRFAPWTDRWLAVRHIAGPDAVEAAYRALLSGKVDPRIADVCTLAGS